jgi:phytoene dehydrogenase-like protein
MKLMESLAKVVREKGGDVRTRCRAKRIIVTNGRATGVIAETDGSEIEITAEVVISNVGPKKTVELAGSENFDKGYLKEMRETLRPAPIIMIALACDRPLTEHPMIIVTDARRVNCIICPTLACPELAPKGKHLLEVGCAPESSIGPINFKKEMEFIMQDIRENLPDFDRYAKILLARRHYADWPGSHTWSGYDLPQKTPVENLYNVGDGVKPSGFTGTSASALSGRIVAEEVRRRITPREA